ncbi:MAG: CHAD domain-containing protein [Polyangiales bacterium]
MAFPSDLGSRSSSVALRQVALAWLKRARRDARDLLKRASEKKLHSFRVSLRRLRALGAHHPELFSKKERATLKSIHRATSRGRDRAVQRRWVRALAEENQLDAKASLRLLPKKKTSKGIVRALRSFAKWDGGVKQRLSTVATPKMNRDTTLATTTGSAVAKVLPGARKALARLADGPSDEELHKARLRVKALRYLMEPLAKGSYELSPLVDECIALQDWLGDAHDLRLLAEHISPGGEEDEATGESLAALTRAAEVQANLQLAKALELGLRHGASDTTPFSSFLDGFERAAERLLGYGQEHLEIERKYLLTALPKGVLGHPCLELDQGYLPGRDIRERVRRIVGPEGTTYRRTIKAGRGISRIEFEEPMDAATFEQLWPLTEGSRVSKRRYVVPDGDLVWEVDEFTDRDLVLAEVELPSADIVPEAPEWLSPYVVRDVSEESGFVNQKLAR